MTDVVRRGPSVAAHTSTAGVLSDLQRFEDVVLDQLQQVGLPDDQVFVEVAERQVMLGNMPAVLAGLDTDTLARSHYISKMIAASAVGLFDAALNYLWDELVSELRRRVVGFDLTYFYDIAAGSSDLRKYLKAEDDLNRVDDANLLRAAREIGLLTDVGFQRLDHIRYMRNHASAAHPNQVDLTGLDLAQWLQVCIKHVITTPPDRVTATTGRLLANLKKDRLDDPALREAAVFFDQLPIDRADTLGNGLFGLYVDPSRSAATADNIRRLWPELWPFLSEDARLRYGLRCARSGASLDAGAATAARELLELVDGTAYLPEDLRAAELDAALDSLMAAHQAMNNFYNEGAPAQQVGALVGESGAVPTAVARKYTRTCEVPGCQSRSLPNSQLPPAEQDERTKAMTLATDGRWLPRTWSDAEYAHRGGLPRPLTDQVEAYLELRQDLLNAWTNKTKGGGDPRPSDGSELAVLALGTAIAEQVTHGRYLEMQDARLAGASWNDIAAAVHTDTSRVTAEFAGWIVGQEHLYARAGFGLDPDQAEAARQLLEAT